MTDGPERTPISIKVPAKSAPDDDPFAAAYREALDRFARGVVLRVAGSFFDELSKRRRALRAEVMALQSLYEDLKGKLRFNAGALQTGAALGRQANALAKETRQLKTRAEEVEADLRVALEDYRRIEQLIDRHMRVRSALVKRSLRDPGRLMAAMQRDPVLRTAHQRYSMSRKKPETRPEAQKSEAPAARLPEAERAADDPHMVEEE